MGMLMHVHPPVEPFNEAVRGGTAGEKIQRRGAFAVAVG